MHIGPPRTFHRMRQLASTRPAAALLRGLLAAVLLLALPASLDAQGFRVRLTGMVVDALGNPVPRVDIVVMGTSFRTLTDTSGKFVLAGLDKGPALVMFRRLGYAPQMMNLNLGADEPPMLVELEREAQVLEGVRVEARGSRQGNYVGKMKEFGERMSSPVYPRSSFMTREEISRGTVRLGDAIRRFQGFRIYRVGGGRERVTSSRGPVSINQRCEPLIFIDGIFHSTADQFDLDGVVVSELEGIEVYRGNASIPARYNLPNAACGVIGLWTRVGS